jgi:hypothetical protein
VSGLSFKSRGFVLTDKQLDALSDALKAKAGSGDTFEPAYADAAHMLHAARMAAHESRWEKTRAKIQRRHQYGV